MTRRDPFETGSSSGDIGVVRRQFGFIVFVQVARFLLYLGTSVALPFFIDPASFGLLLLVSVPISLAQLFGDFGIAESLVRARTLDSELASLLFWIALGLGLVSATVVIGSVPLFEAWYETEGLFSLSVAFSVLLLLRIAGSQYRALLRRQLRLKAMNWLELGTSLVTNSATILLALLGVGVISVPIGLAAGAMCELIGFAIITWWVPGRPAKLSGAGSSLRFGVGLSVSGALLFGGVAVSNLLLGRFIPEAQLGLFERATAMTRGVIDRLQSIGSRLLYPLLSRCLHSHGETGRIGRPLLSAAFVIWTPAVVLAAVAMGPVLRSIYGSEWEDLGRMVSLLTLSFAVWLPGQVLFQSLLAHGRTRYLVLVNGARFILWCIAAAISAQLGSVLLFVVCTSALNLVMGCWNLWVIRRLVRWEKEWSALEAGFATIGAALPAGLFLLAGFLSLHLGIGLLAGVVSLAGMVVFWVRSPRSAEFRSLFAS